MRPALLLVSSLICAQGYMYMHPRNGRRQENYLGSGKAKDSATIKPHMISTALHMFTPETNGSGIATFSIDKMDYHLSKDSAANKELYDVECDPIDIVMEPSFISCKERVRCARNFSDLHLEDVPSTYLKRKQTVLNWFCNKGEHCCEMECCTYKRSAGLMFGLFVLGAVLLIGLILCLVRLLENVRENRRMEQYAKQVQAVYRPTDGGRVDLAT